MSDMFYGCSSLTDVDLSGFDTRNVESMSFMFYGCSSLESVILPSKLTSIGRYAFYDCSRLMTIEVDTSHPLTLEAETFAYETIRDGHVLLRERSQEMKKKFQKCGFTHFEYR